MNDHEQSYQVAIVGGGPVGLFLGCLLQQKGISCIILEKREKSVEHSRSIGIHPVSLEYFATIGLAEKLIEKGVKVNEGIAFAGRQKVGTLSFASCPPPYPFILTLPQNITEELLVSHLQRSNNLTLRRGTEVTGLSPTKSGMKITTTAGGTLSEINTRYVVGCDGKNSNIRDWTSIPFDETWYDDTYMMGDFSDNTDFGSSAVVYICKEGLIESFPLPDRRRRWVVKTDQYHKKAERAEIEAGVKNRINHSLEETNHYMLSSFGTQKGLAKTMVKGRVILAGDAAHVVSPIGGQGMNLGWLDAWELACSFEKIFNTDSIPESVLDRYSKKQLKTARKVIRRSEFNMALGRKSSGLLIKKAALNLLLKRPVAPLMARLFTMRGLSALPF